MKELGTKLANEGKYAEALKWFRQCLGQAQSDGDQWMVASCLGNIGTIFAIMNDFGSAFFYFEKSFQTAEKIKANDLTWIACSNLVIACSKIDKLNEAMEYARINARVTPSQPSPEQLFMLIKNDYIIANCRKDARESLSIAKNMHHFADSAALQPFYRVTSLSYLGEALQNSDSIEKAIDYFKQAINLAEKSNLPDFKAQVLNQLANGYAAAGLHDLEEVARLHATSFADSLYDQTNFEIAKLNFLTLQDKESQHLVNNLRRTINWQTVTIVAICAFLIVIILMVIVTKRLNNKLQHSYKAIYDRYSELIGLQEKELKEEYEGNGGCVDEETDAGTVLLNRIMEVMDNPEFTSNPDFSITILTREVGSNTKYVSSVINKRCNRNFRTLLNEKRIKEACRLILRDPKMTSQELAEKSGYKSVSGFYSSFKAILAMTPAEFRRQKIADNRQTVSCSS